jgi:hypothetical protein
MKKNLFKFAGLVISSMLFGACSQMATFENEDLLLKQEAAAKSGFNLTPFGTGNENARTSAPTDCAIFCIDPANPEYSVQSAQINNNSGPQTRVFTYTVYNTLTGFELAWNYESANNAGRKLKITVSGAGFASPKTYTSNQLNGGPANGTNSFAFDASWAACNDVTVVAEILDGDNIVVSGPNTTTYKLIGRCVVGCVDTFSAVLNCDDTNAKTLTVSFTPETSGSYVIQGGLNANAVISNATATSPLTRNTTHPSVVNGQASVTRWEGSLTACTPYTVTITYSGGNGVGGWSAKMGEVVHGSSNMQSCP